MQTFDHNNFIKSSIKVTNSCKVTQDLTDYQLAFVSEDLERNKFLLSDLTAVNIHKSIYSLDFTSYSTDEVKHDHESQRPNVAVDILCGFGQKSGCDVSMRPKNLIIGNFSSNQLGDVVIEAGQTIEFSGETQFERNVGYNFDFAQGSFTSYLAVEKVPTFGLLICDPLRAHHESDISIVRGGTIAEAGVKTVEVTNATASKIAALEFPSELPVDVTYDLRRTTCLLNGHQYLVPRQSCLLVFKYAPKIDSVIATMIVKITGLTQVNGVDQKITSSPMDIVFTATEVKQEFYDAKKTNVALTDLIVESQSSVSHNNDSLTDVMVSSFGLKTLIVTNNTTFNIYGLTFPLLPSEFSYDSHTTCKTSVGNKPMLLPGGKCVLVIRYTPSHAGAKGELPIAITGVNNYYDVVANKALNLEYSSHK